MRFQFKFSAKYFNLVSLYKGCWDSAFSMATQYGLDHPRIEFQWRQDFSCHPASCTMGTGSFQGVKWRKRGADHPPPCSVGLQMGWSYTFPSPLCLYRHVT